MTDVPQVARKQAMSRRLRRKRREGGQPIATDAAPRRNASIDCGWGRLLFAQTYDTPQELADALRAEGPDRRDIALYVAEPHVALSCAPQELFLDPSHTFRLDLASARLRAQRRRSFFLRRLTTQADADAINAIYAARAMVPVPPDFFWSKRDDRGLTVFVAEDAETGEVIGTAMGVDHARVFDDPENGASLWSLAVDPQARHPGVGEALVVRVADHFQTRGAAFLDLSVIHDNDQAIQLYEKLGFRRVNVFAVKRKNPINEKLFAGTAQEDDGLNPYARIITNEARRRGIAVDVTDAEGGLFRLTYGGRSVSCRESLSEFTSAVAMSICDDKRVTRRIVGRAGVRIPEQCVDDNPDARAAFLDKMGSVVVKPARGEQGRGVAVDLRDSADVEAAVAVARTISDAVILESFHAGDDLRLVVINYRLVAAAIRRPAMVVGDGAKTVTGLIEAQSRRRAAATGGESRIPLDDETRRCVAAAGWAMDDAPPPGTEIVVRKAANLHTGGTIHDVTAACHPALVDAAVKVAKAIEIPCVGVDFIVADPMSPDYVFIEANERPGLANHEPQPTAERFVDLLFPLSVPQAVREAQRKARE